MTLTNKNIEQLIALCKSGNQLAQLEVYNRYYKAMYNAALRILNDRFEAEDVMQDSFLTAFTKLDTINDSLTFGAWLKRIVINNSIYHFNKNSKYKNIPIDNVLYKVEGDDLSTDFESESTIKAKTLLKGMEDLKDSYRIALTLHLIEGYDYDEMSTILNMSYANCRTTVSRAKESLRQKMQTVVNN